MHMLISQEMRNNGDVGRSDGDPWGQAMLTLGAICDLLTLVGESDRIPPEAGYRPAWGLSFDEMLDSDTELGNGGEYRTQLEFHQAMHLDEWGAEFVDTMPELTVDDLAHAAAVLNRYCNLLVLADRDY